MSDLSQLLAPQSEPITDLSWFEVGEDYQNYPGNNSTQNAVPELVELQFGGPAQGTAMPVAAYIAPGRTASATDEDIVASVKKAAMIGADITSYVKDRYSDDQIKKAASAITAIASEIGLLGNVYIDLSPFQTLKQAAAAIGPNRLKSASFVVGTPQHESSICDENNRCRGLGLPVVSDIDSALTPDVLMNYEKHLKAYGLIPESMTIGCKDDLRNAFLMASVGIGSEPTHVAEYDPTFKTDESDFGSRIEPSPEVIQNQVFQGAEHPVLRGIQDIMLQGHKGGDLIDIIRDKYAAETLQPFRTSIAGMIGRQGLLGDELVLVDLYKNASEAISAIKTAKTRPTFIACLGEDVHGRLPIVASATGLKILNETGLDVHTASELIYKKSASGIIHADVAEPVLEKLASGSINPVDALMSAHMQTFEKRMAGAAVRQASQFGIAFDEGCHNGKDSQGADTSFMASAAAKAIEAGIPDTDTVSHMASSVGTKKACDIFASALGSAEIIPADVLTKCASQKYSIGSARIKTASKCGSCVYSCGGHCSKQGAKFASANTRTASYISEEERVIQEALGNL